MSELKGWINLITDTQYPQSITNEWIEEQLNADKKGGFNDFMMWGFCYRDLRKSNFQNIDKSLLLKIPFNSYTKWPKYLPAGFSPQLMLKKRPLGYGFNEVHQQGFTGKGVLVAVIDHPSNINHIEISKQVKEVIVLEEKYNCSHFHGLAVISHLCGKSIGIAPEAEVIFYAGQPLGGKTKEERYDRFNHYAIMCLKDIKKQIIMGKSIRIVNLSNSWLTQGNSQLKAEAKLIRDELESMGCVVIDSPRFFENFCYLNCIGGEDIQNIDNYQQPAFFQNDEMKSINFVSGGTFCASYLSKRGYEYNPVGSASYSIPQLCGLYA